jgi:hypothetical protein
VKAPRRGVHARSGELNPGTAQPRVTFRPHELARTRMSGTGDGRAGTRSIRPDDGGLDGVRAGCRLLVRARRTPRAGAIAKDQGGAFAVFIADGLPRYHADPRIFPRRRGCVVPGIGGVECVRRSWAAGRRAKPIHGSDHRVAAAPGRITRFGPTDDVVSIGTSGRWRRARLTWRLNSTNQSSCVRRPAGPALPPLFRPRRGRTRLSCRFAS